MILVIGSQILWPLLAFALQKPRSTHPTATSELLDRARKLIQEGNPQDALTILQQAQLGSSYDSDVHAMKGICQAMLARPIESAIEFDQAIALRPNYAPNYFSSGLAFATFNNLDRALDQLSMALRLDPHLPGLRFNYALVLARAGQYAESEKQVDIELSNIRSTQESVDLWHLKARDAYFQKKWQDTLAAYKKVQEITPNLAETYAAIGEALYSLNRPQESMVELRRAAALDPKNGSVHALMGKLYQSQDQEDQAIGEFEIAYRLIPSDQEVVYRLYRIYIQTGDKVGAARLQKQLGTLLADKHTQSANEQKAVSLNNKGIELESKGEVLDALDYYDQAAKADVTNLIFRRNAALLLCRMGRTQEAIRRLRDILSFDPDDAESQQILAVANELAAGDPTKKSALPGAQRSAF